MKHLKIRGELTKDNRVRLTILSNSHPERSFGIMDSRYWSVRYGSFVHKNLRMYTVDFDGASPDFDEYPGDSNKSVTHKFRVGDVGKSCFVSLDEYKLIKEAVIAYNEWGVDQN